LTGRLRDRLRAIPGLAPLVRRVRGIGLRLAKPAAQPSRPTPADRQTQRPLEDRVTELRRVTFVESPRTEYRLNLIVPTVEGAGTFGGIRTALDLFEAIAADADQRRIISIGRAGPGGGSAIPDYHRVEPGDDTPAARQYVALTKPFDRLAVRSADVFVSTFWTTAELTARIRRWQAQSYGSAPALAGYVIQDFEPGFYPYSAAWMLARSTYADRAGTVAIFNTSLLRDHIHGEGFGFDHEFVFEPRLLPELRAARARPEIARKRRILVYGRPGTPRNAFPAIVDGLRAWRATDPEAGGWEVLSVGREHPEIALGDGTSLRSIGKLELHAYADLLRESAIGVSLMVSPHPSYPPLEMAHLGMLVLTNRFGAKDLSTWHPNIKAVGDISAESLAAAMSTLSRRFDADPGSAARTEPLRTDFISETPPFAFAGEVASLLRRGSESPVPQPPVPQPSVSQPSVPD
jgi:WsaF, C-terminal domain/WsaF, N-terminal domain